MCGINGYATPGGAIDLRLVEAMNAGLHHRGPDEGGVIDAGFAGLGMRRLSIVDLAGGSQPMTSGNARHSLVYNGELYDHAAERADLRARGASFRTASDTEVVLEAWARDGAACLERFNGMFAFAVADRDERELVLVRDPVGIKPLYYWCGPDGQLVFSSELQSLLAHPRVPRDLDRDSLAMLLTALFFSLSIGLTCCISILLLGAVAFLSLFLYQIRLNDGTAASSDGGDSSSSTADFDPVTGSKDNMFDFSYIEPPTPTP